MCARGTEPGMIMGSEKSLPGRKQSSGRAAFSGPSETHTRMCLPGQQLLRNCTCRFGVLPLSVVVRPGAAGKHKGMHALCMAFPVAERTKHSLSLLRSGAVAQSRCPGRGGGGISRARRCRGPGIELDRGEDPLWESPVGPHFPPRRFRTSAEQVRAEFARPTDPRDGDENLSLFSRA